VNVSLSFFGREIEMSQLRALYDQRKHVLITGSAGTGKSALLNQFRSRSPLLLCDDTSKPIRICEGLERQLGWDQSQMNVFERMDSLLTYVKRRGEAIAFDHVEHTSPGVARFIDQLSKRVPVWIACRSELPNDVGNVWKSLSGFVLLRVSPLKKTEVRVLLAQAVARGAVHSDAHAQFDALYRVCGGNPRLLEELLIELSTYRGKREIDFGRGLLTLDRRIQKLKANLDS
jgi:hypothetical protein